MIRFTAIAVFGILVILGYWFSDSARARNVAGIFDELVNGSPGIDQDAFEARALAAVNETRGERGLPHLKADTQIHDAVARYGTTHSRLSELSLEGLFGRLQNEFPGAQFLSATVLLDPRDEGLHQSLADWKDVADPQYDTLSTLAFRDGLRKGCVAVLARRLPPFDLETANRDGGRFFQRCPHCQKAHAVLLDRQSQTLILNCPDCRQPYDVLAADTEGKFRRAPDFFEGFHIPDQPKTGDDPEATLVEIWSAVLRHCEYEYDRTSTRKGEAWKLPSQTWNDAAGDCEDTAILLADALNAAGIEARVAIGWNIHIGQHAWCVARIDNRQWVLESTLQLKDGETPELRTVVNAAGEYQPEQLFDRERLYFRHDGKERAGCDNYWSEAKWKPLPGR